MAGNTKFKSVFVRTEFDYSLFELKGRNRDTGDPKLAEYPAKKPFDSYDIDSPNTPVAELEKAHLEEIARFFADKDVRVNSFKTYLCTKTPLQESRWAKLNPWKSYDTSCRLLAEGHSSQFFKETELTDKLTASAEVMALMQPEETKRGTPSAANAVRKSTETQSEEKMPAKMLIQIPYYSKGNAF